MAYNLLGQQGNKGDRNPDPNLTAEQATYLYDTPPGSGDNKGLNNAGKPVDKKDVEEKLEDVGVTPTTDTTDTTDKTDTTPSVSGNEAIRNAQTLLKNAGFDPGVIDGLNGPNTKAAAEAYIGASRGTTELNKRRKEVGFIIGVKAPDTTTTDTTTEEDDVLETTTDEDGREFVVIYDKDGNRRLVIPGEEEMLLNLQPPKFFTSPPGATAGQGQTGGSFADLINNTEFGPSISVDATSYDVDKLNKELGITDTSLGSAIKRGWERAVRGDMGANEYLKLVEDVEKARSQYNSEDTTLAEKAGAFLRAAAIGAGVATRSTGAVLEETLGGLFNAGTDLIRPEAGGTGDAFFDALMGVEQGSNAYSTWVSENKPGWRYDAFENEFYDITTDKKITQEEITEATVTPGGTPNGGPSGGGPGGSGPSGGADVPDEAYNAIGQLGPRGQSNEGYEYKFEKPPGRGNNPGVTKIGDLDPDPIDQSAQTAQNYIESYQIRIYKDGESILIDVRELSQYESDGWSTQQLTAEATSTTDTTTSDVGPGQVVNDQLNTFNNIPQNAILIEAAGQLFLGYEVPGAYGQMYSGNPMFMLYEVLDNDVYDAGILTQGATPQVNVSLGSLADLNQYGIVVGGTDELTENVEHPFIRFVENFEAGKRVNPWLNDTEINPISGVSYQQEAIEFLAEQALEQWSPEETQLKYEGTEWYRKSTTTQKQWLTTLLTQPQQATQDIQDKQLSVRIAMEANGIASPPDALVSWFADKAVSGTWTQLYTDNQIALLADPYKPGARDTGMVNFIEGVGVGTLDRLSVGEKTVTDLYRRYLGPSLGNASSDEIAEKAGQLRNDPDAEEQLKSYLEQQRLAMFGKYTNPTLTYNDIVQPYKNLVNQVWGQEVDETQDWFIKMVQDNDIEQAYTTLREKGISQGIGRVQDQALNDLQSSIGQGQVAPQLGANG